MAPRPMTRIDVIVLAAIMVCGAALRLYGLDWDGGHWLHPDERQIYFVAMNLGWPQSWAEALSPDSPLNPGFFAYGSLPIYLVRLVAQLLAPLFPALRDLDMLHWAGRSLAVLFDLATIALTYRLVVRLWSSGTGRDRENGPARISGNGPALLAAALVSLAVLHVQLAHFYTADPLLTFFVMLVLNLAAGPGTARSAWGWPWAWPWPQRSARCHSYWWCWSPAPPAAKAPVGNRWPSRAAPSPRLVACSSAWPQQDSVFSSSSLMP